MKTRKVMLSLLLVGVFMFTSLEAVYAQDATGIAAVSSSTEVVSPYLTLMNVTYADGTQLEAAQINGPSQPPAEFEAERQASMQPEPATGTLSNFPSFKWVFGCSAVSGAMIATYYDRGSYPKMYTGPTAGGVMPLTDTSWPTWSDGYVTYPNNPLIASHKGVDGRGATVKGSIDDYWIKYGSTAKDPYITGSWTQHAWSTAVGDYMKTSQSKYSSTDGSTWFYTNGATKLQCADMPNYNSGFGWGKISDFDGTYGRKLFYQARGYTVTDCYAQATDNMAVGGFSLANFKAQIDAGHPVLLNLTGHSIVGYGYSGSTIYIRDTWDNNTAHTYTMPWGGSYSGMAMRSVSIVRLAGGAPVVIPTPVAPAGTITDTTPTFKWKKITNATKYEFRLYKGTNTTALWTKSALAGDCGTTYCTKTPTTPLVKSSYNWQARAYVGGAWKAWSAKKAFTLSVPTSGFNSQFNGNMTGWAKKGTVAFIAGTSAMYSNGVANNWAQAYWIANTFNNVNYSARLRRGNGDQTSANTMFVRMGGSLGTVLKPNAWYPGYWFEYANNGYYSIWKISSAGSYTALQSWAQTTAIVKNGWNTLKVYANGSTFKFYINNTLVKTVTDTYRTSGYVGLGFADYGNTSDKFEADWATLTKLSAKSVNTDEVSAEQEALNEAANAAAPIGDVGGLFK